MDLSKYMTFEAEWTPCTGQDEDTMTLEFGTPVKIKCFKYGKNIYIRDSEGNTSVSAQVYLTTENINTKDLIDGQVVKSVNNYPESWDDRNVLKECLTWNE